jgi:hypothetical protein
MASKSAQSVLRTLVNAFPLRFNALLLLLLSWAAYSWIQGPRPGADTATPDSVTPLVILLLQIAGLTLALLIALTLLLTLVAWAGLLWRSRRGKKPVALDFSTAPAGGLLLKASLEVSPLPFWGAALLTVFFEEGGTAGPVLLERQGFSLWPAGRRTWRSTAPLTLQRVQTYKVSRARVQLRDVFGLFALPVTLPANALAVNKPASTGADIPTLPPSRTIDFTERIEELKPVEGELFQYKNFEAGDDMRRIVWKVYARTRDLVVRTPERLEPYASHIDLWASFGAALPLPYDVQNNWVQELLSHYKSALWALYQSVSRQGLRPHFHADQEVAFSGGEADGPAAMVQNAITGAQWIAGHSLPTGAGSKGEVVVVSSLIAPDALQRLLHGGKGPSAVCLVALSEAIPPPPKKNLILRIFLRPAHTPESRLRQGWQRSPLRLLLQRREAELRALLEESGVRSIHL